jgi:ferredoxin-NADP reductase/ferredoxin
MVSVTDKSSAEGRVKSKYYIKTTRTFTALRRYAWIFTLTVAFGGLWYPRLGLLVFGVIFGLTAISLFKGRYWCGNYCAHGSLFDQVLFPFSLNGKIPSFLRSKLVQAAVFSWFMYNLTSKFFRVSTLWGKWIFWDRLGFVFVTSYLMVTIAGGLLGLFITPRTWCQFCPMGTMQMLMYRLGKKLGWTRQYDQKITLEEVDKCHKCAKCARVCPMHLVPYTDFSEENQFDHEACIRCLTCVENCPARILSLNTADEAADIRSASDRTGYEFRRRITARIGSIAELTPDIREFTFRFLEPAEVEYQPGQFFLVRIQNEPEIFRAYSISGTGDGREVRLAVKRVPGGFGTEIIFDQFQEGMEVILEGPMGHELLIDPEAQKILLVAGGIGITPFIPILQNLAVSGKHAELVYGANTEGDLVFDQTLRSLAAESENIEYLPVVARGEAAYAGNRGFVTDVIRDLDLGGYYVYMCGPQGMVDAVTKLLKDKGVPKDKIFAESA